MRLPLAMLVTLTLAACSNEAPGTDPGPEPQPEETGMRFITLDGDALETARAALAQRNPGARLDVVDMWNNVAVVQWRMRGNFSGYRGAVLTAKIQRCPPSGQPLRRRGPRAPR